MSNKIQVLSYSVEVEPKSIGDFGYIVTSDRLIEPNKEKRLKEYKDICEQIVDDINRHVDNVGYVSVVEETENICEFCGGIWNPDTYGFYKNCNGCCQREIEDWCRRENWNNILRLFSTSRKSN